MTTGAWLVLLGTWLVAVASPGPDFLAVLRTSLNRGRGAGWAVAAGVTAGIAVWITAALLGIVALVSSHSAAALIMRWAGVVFLVIYGGWILRGVLREWRERARAAEAPAGSRASSADASGSSRATPAEAPTSAHESSSGQSAHGSIGNRANPARMSAMGRTPTTWQSVRLGFLTNTVGNPKAVVFFGALFASILPPGIGFAESLAVAGAMVLVAFLWFSLVASVAGRRVVVAAYQRAQLWIDGFLGVLFIALGLALIPWQGV